MRSATITGLRLVRAGWHRQSRYRLAMLAGLATNIVFGFIRAAIMTAAIHSSGGHLAGYTQGTLSAYVWLSQGMLGAIKLFAGQGSEFAERVKSGDVAIDFIRPLDVQLGVVSEDFGGRLYSLLPRGVPSVLIGALVVGMTLPRTALPYLMGAFSVVLAIALSLLAAFIVELAGFWLIETRGVGTLYTVTASFLAGLFVPVALFPGWLHAIAVCTPFPSMLQAPINVISGQVSGLHLAETVVAQAGWLVGVVVLGRVVLSAGRRRLEVQGG